LGLYGLNGGWVSDCGELHKKPRKIHQLIAKESFAGDLANKNR
jgi:hypothetical protein